MSKVRHPLYMLCLAFVILVLMHSFATPVFEAPDEVWHYAYVRWLAEGHGLPAMDDNASGANQEVAQPPLYYAVAALFSLPFPDDDLDTLFWGNPGFGYQAPGTIPDNKNMLIHTSQERFPWQGAVLTIHITRLASLLFGLLAVVALWGLGYETFASPRDALLATALVAFHPQFVFMCSVVSNDSAATALCTVALWSIARFVRQGLTARRALVTGALVGLATLTKTSAILLFPLASVAMLWQIWRSRALCVSVKDVFLDLKASLFPFATFCFAALLTGGWWYIRNTLVYGEPLGMSSHVNTLWGRAEPASLIELIPELPLLLRSFWGAYGWGHITWSPWVYVILWVGSGYFLLRGVLKLLSSHTMNDKATVDVLTILTLAGLWGIGIFAALLQWMRQVEAPHGRLLFPALGAWAILVAYGMVEDEKLVLLDRFLNRAACTMADMHTTMVSLFLIFMGGLAALAPSVRIMATFAPPRLRAPQALMPGLTPADLNFADQARLLGIAINEEHAEPGDTFTVKACWEALKPIKEDYTVFVHLIGPENIRVAERHTYPGLGRFPTSLWPVGRAFCDVYPIPIAPWAEGNIRYYVEIGLFNADTAVRLPATHNGGQPLEPPIVGDLIVAYPSSKAFNPQTYIQASVGDTIRLYAFDSPDTVSPGETLPVTLYWEAVGRPGEDLIAFVHVWRPGDPQPLAQHDGPPRGGWYPTSLWQPGDIVVDEHTLIIPSDLPPGTYPLWAGLYRNTDGTRVNASGPNGPYRYNLIPLGELRLE